MRERELTRPLRQPLFRRLAASYGINELGDWMGAVALAVLVFDHTGSALASSGLFLGTRFLPAFLAPVLVTRVERRPPRLSLPLIYGAEAATFGGLALLAVNFSLPAVIALGVLDGTLALTGRALTRTVVAALLQPSGELRAGNALLNIPFTGAAAVGPALAGLIIAGFGVQVCLLLDAASFALIAVILATAGHLPQVEPEPGRTRERVRAGIEYLRQRTWLRRLLISQGVVFVFFAAVIPIEVIYAKQTLGTGDSGYGLLLASWGVGMVLGGGVNARLRSAPLPLLLFFSTIAVGVGYLGLAIAPTLAAACAASVLGGIGNGVQWVSVINAVQELTAERMLARVTSVLESIGAAMPGVGYALGGLIAAGADPRVTFLVAGIGVLVVVAIAAFALGRDWPVQTTGPHSRNLDGDDESVLELIPAINKSIQSDSEGVVR